MEKAGLYIHIPFCAYKCPYCDFYSGRYEESAAEKYVERAAAEFEKWRGAEFDTVYLGGGTPSILPARLIARLLEAAGKSFCISGGSEITIECNPSKDLTADIREYAAMGINRVSLGMQSAVDEERRALGRRAGAAQVEAAVCAAQSAGIENISLDVMLGIPKQTKKSLEKTFDFIRKLGVPHISAYMLKLEENTPFYKMKDSLELPGDDDTAEMYLKTCEAMEAAGLRQYEISNFARPGFESRHNMKYWRLIPYLGIGASAHSFWGGERFHYSGDMEIISDGSGGSYAERVMLGLRLCEGVETQLIKKDISPYVRGGFMRTDGARVSFTPRGFLVSNTILSELIDEI